MDNLSKIHPFRKALFFTIFGVISYFCLDREILIHLSPQLKPLSKALSLLIFPPFHLLLWGLLFLIARSRMSVWTLPLFETFISQCFSVAFVRITKVLIGRARPDIYIKKGIYGFHGFEWNHHFHSFPSGHTLMIFTLATSLSLAFPRWKTPLFSLATLLALSRVLLTKHYLSDVMGTAAIGIILATIVHLIIRRTYYATA